MNRPLPLLLALVVALPLAAPAAAERSPLRPEPEAVQEISRHSAGSKADERGGSTVVVLDLVEDGLAAYRGGLSGLGATSPAVTGEERLDTESRDARRYRQHLHRRIDTAIAQVSDATGSAEEIYRYDAVLGGVAVRVPADQVARLTRIPGVADVFPLERLHIDTDNSADFLDMGGLWSQAGGQGAAGEGIIVGVVDTGIWPEHPSFTDDGMPAPPSRWRGGECDFGNQAWNPADDDFTCNNKLIGASTFLATWEPDSEDTELDEEEFYSARDSDGHGTHTASTAAGDAGVAATVMGSDLGTISGMAPRAHVAAYRACAGEGGYCYNIDTAAAINQAVADGVHIINYSIGGGNDPYKDVVSKAMLDAYDAGVLVATSAGNSGPGADTVGHREPWTVTVAASTQDRTFATTVTLTAHDGTQAAFTGASLTGGASGTVVLAEDYASEPTDEESVHAARHCLEPFPADTFETGEIVVCERGLIARVSKSANVSAGGAAGLILYNAALEGEATDNHFLPTVHVEYEEAEDEAHPHAIVEFVQEHDADGPVTGSFPDASAQDDQGDVTAAFSSRGGPRQRLGISKPDVTAPGVHVLAGHTPAVAFPAASGGSPGELFRASGGTSMSAPHVAGVAAVLQQVHGTWTPSRIRSALMLTGLLDGVTKEDGTTPADAFDVGSGRIRPSLAVNAGLTMEETGARYRELEDRLWEANYPSLYVPVLVDEVTVSRRVRNETPLRATWLVSTDGLEDVGIDVPDALQIDGGAERTFDIRLDAREMPVGAMRTGRIVLTRGHEVLHIPVTVERVDPDISVDITCDPSEVPQGQRTECSITLENPSPSAAELSLVNELPAELDLDEDSVEGADVLGDAVTWSGRLAGAGGRRIITYAATGVATGHWANAAVLFADQYAGPQTDVEEGTVLEPVAPVLESLSLAPDTASVPVGGTRQFTATASYDDGSDVDVTDEATWSSSDTGVATIDGAGLATGGRGGTTTITASFGGQSDTASLTVTSEGTGPEPGPEPEPLPAGTFRLSGSGRLQTAVEVSRGIFDARAAGAVVIARANTFPDALAGTPLAVDRDAPMLLSPTESLHTVTREEILRVLPAGGTVYLLGGESALSPAVRNELDALGYRTVRLAGPTRIETARAVAEELGNPDRLLITTGYDFPDALAAGAAAAEVGGAVLLTTANAPHPALSSYLAAHPTARTYTVGGPAARAYPAATAVSGSTREGTAVRVAETFFDDPTVIGFARRDDFPDALAGGAHIGRLGGPLLLTPTGMLHPTPAAYTCAHADTLQTAFGYGGTSALSADTLVAIAARVDGDGC